MYSSSVTTGDFEKFISHDVVAYIDGHYRTIPDRLSRGLVGHSMGGDGATRIGMKHSDVFGSLYIVEPLLPLSARPGQPRQPGNRQSPRGGQGAGGFGQVAVPSRARNWPSAAAWSPDPRNPPLYLDLPVKDGVPQPDVLAKVDGECAAGLHRPIHWRSTEVLTALPSTWRRGWLEVRRGKAARSPGHLWNCQHL